MDGVLAGGRRGTIVHNSRVGVGTAAVGKSRSARDLWGSQVSEVNTRCGKGYAEIELSGHFIGDDSVVVAVGPDVVGIRVARSESTERIGTVFGGDGGAVAWCESFGAELNDVLVDGRISCRFIPYQLVAVVAVRHDMHTAEGLRTAFAGTRADYGEVEAVVQHRAIGGEGDGDAAGGAGNIDVARALELP